MHRSGLRVVDLLNSALLRTHIENAATKEHHRSRAFRHRTARPKAMYEDYSRARRADCAVCDRHRRDAERGHRQRREGDVRGRAGSSARHRPWNVSFRHIVFFDSRRRGDRYWSWPTRIGTVIGVTKAYVTRVGEGPFPTEIHDNSADLLRARGQEYGAVTGRPRRCGWLDLPLLRYSNMINGTEWLVVTKMDVMDECAEIPVCIGYKINGKLTDVIPPTCRGMARLSRSTP